jgi:enoyl-[acyl-carrier protein] reductase II
MYPEIDTIMDIIISEGVKIVFTSAGNPKLWTKKLQEKGIIVVHVVSSSRFALKCEEAGVDAVVAEGFEAGGHNGREETTTMVLIPQVRKTIGIPLIAAGGIATGNSMLAVMALGAEGIQMGSRFALTQESSASLEFKDMCIGLKEGDTILSLKKLSPTRLVKNDFYNIVQAAEDRGASAEEMREILGRGRSKKGIFEGNLTEGELEIGQISSLIDNLPAAAEVMENIIADYNKGIESFCRMGKL